MKANTLPADSLGGFLRDRRSRLQPTSEPGARRRTPGLRREEVAARAGVSVTWYTWLEQGRGGAPSDDALERLARALELDPAARELLFLLGRQRLPPPMAAPVPAVPPAVQAVLDSLVPCPAVVKTVCWDLVAWNTAAIAVLGDNRNLPARERNGLRRLFGDPAGRGALLDWEANARFILGVFRVDLAREGPGSAAAALAAELDATSADFRRLWAENDVRAQGVGMKRYQHPIAGPLTFTTSSFTVDGADGLGMIVFTPATAADAAAVAGLLAHKEQRLPEQAA